MDIPLLKFDRITSTNATARTLIADGTITRPCCVVAQEQTRGRGTHGRRWASPRNAGIYATVVDPRCAGAPVPQQALSIAAGRACCAVLRHHTGVAVDIAGVNDLVVGGGKLGGILVETSIVGQRMGPVIIGIGINTAECPRDIDDAKRPAVSLESCMHSSAYTRIVSSELTRALAIGVCQAVEETVRGQGAD